MCVSWWWGGGGGGGGGGGHAKKRWDINDIQIQDFDLRHPHKGYVHCDHVAAS